ncbi:phospho-N-acetylmuramoyl-pentapeptide-transferase [Novibacillus thermophilus]|jgi:phospho-N-acetylmuramoyl-pentapeptide-transferase|uniref:Phospho-N-acetylmuramoyl-pentapeptide-transferase n=1 Tax=Novibacillus thermophilus TaxID=1471761 RepID=A0A1U9K631_9BACL|nr:phospho-N-acetylmuramoyl-pentapeptide-transferase [Novibacillus thermophilus]AQS55517.1 phospho-N-acetylmuramoyl-pentapeptide-transferase [Novibacillus thermophilus]
MDVREILIPIVVSFLITVLVSPLFIPVLRRLKFGQSIREEGPRAHYKKAGTPTMGGIIILLSLTLTSLAFVQRNTEWWILLFATLGYGAIGFLDDFIKIALKRSLGLTAKQKLAAQLIVAGGLYWILIRNGFSTDLSVPGTDWSIDLGWLYFPFLALIMLATSNAVNLTDGLDGLLAGTAAIAFGAFAVIGLMFSQYTVALFSVAVVGALLGFLVFNAHPARVFMGDTGSLALGGGLAATAVLTKSELLLIVIGGVFVIETLSVMLQVMSFKLRGKRIFRMSPIHHHFELAGWSEWRVVATFWAVGFLFAAVGLLLGVKG